MRVHFVDEGENLQIRPFAYRATICVGALSTNSGRHQRIHAREILHRGDRISLLGLFSAHLLFGADNDSNLLARRRAFAATQFSRLLFGWQGLFLLSRDLGAT